MKYCTISNEIFTRLRFFEPGIDQLFKTSVERGQVLQVKTSLIFVKLITDLFSKTSIVQQQVLYFERSFIFPQEEYFFFEKV